MQTVSPEPAPAPARIVLYGRAGCHLCEVAREDLERLAAETGVGFAEVDVDSDPDIRQRYGDLVPVVTVDGVQQGYWQIDPDQVRAALG
ncbi:glutaredoxin family protein [Georgenia sp. TF02-10]|uniref:glutaredoxin family protein n=1 Tax=Georgenia sp. TF02-10 TaxID=2917725 RepID=UPI001FA6CF91|nr:glutaredoxin family protein [Georgenia sp. TF02-10]UNX54442.1 glutaredoxin family protein [Georgenia sp. TF02-10]